MDVTYMIPHFYVVFTGIQLHPHFYWLCTYFKYKKFLSLRVLQLLWNRQTDQQVMGPSCASMAAPLQPRPFNSTQ